MAGALVDEEDCVELFLAPEPERADRYYEVELGPLGHCLDLEIDRTSKSSRVEWSSGVTVKTSHDAERRTAIIEARLNAPELVSTLRAGARLPQGIAQLPGVAPASHAPAQLSRRGRVLRTGRRFLSPPWRPLTGWRLGLIASQPVPTRDGEVTERKRRDREA